MIPKERIESYLRMEKEGYEVVYPFELCDEFSLFLTACFSIKRMIVVKVTPTTAPNAQSELRKYAECKGFEWTLMTAEQLTVTDVRGGFDQSGNWHEPSYWPRCRKMIVVEGVHATTDEALLRAFLRVACLGGSSPDSVSTDGSLPKGSGFVFLAQSDFPYDRFGDISSYWREESAIFDYDSQHKPENTADSCDQSHASIKDGKTQRQR